MMMWSIFLHKISKNGILCQHDLVFVIIFIEAEEKNCTTEKNKPNSKQYKILPLLVFTIQYQLKKKKNNQKTVQIHFVHYTDYRVFV